VCADIGEEERVQAHGRPTREVEEHSEPEHRQADLRLWEENSDESGLE
jgi:hypothetical protein